MEIPVIDFSELNGDGRSKTMALLHQACEQWGFFQEFFMCSKAMNEYIAQLLNLAEKLSELMCENLGLENHYIKKAFSGSNGSPSVGTKVAKYPQCSKPECVRGLREHTDAGGIILMLQEDQIPGLEFFKDGKWVPIPLCKKNTIFVNTGDALEVLSNGRYKTTVHRVMTNKDGSRLSIATFSRFMPLLSSMTKDLEP